MHRNLLITAAFLLWESSKMIVYNVLNIYGHLPYALPSNHGLPLNIVTFGKQESLVTRALNANTKIQI